MPTYEYACSSCQNEWELEQSIKDDPITECPRCHNATAKRQISRGGGFILKGGGWYADLYSSSSNAKPEGAKTESTKSEGGDASKTSDASSKPAESSASSSGSSSSSSSEGSSSSSTTKSSASAA